MLLTGSPGGGKISTHMQLKDYRYHTKPFEHQDEAFRKTAELPIYGLFWEQGVAKTKPMIDTAAYLYENGKIDTLLVIAPNGVHQNWITDEIPAHMPRWLASKIRMAYWESRKANTKKHARKIADVAEHDGFRIMTFNYDAMMTMSGIAAIGSAMKGHDVFLVFDESHYLKTPGAKRTKRAIALAKRAKYRRILTGTPYANSPFDAYAQLRCLDADFWKPHGFAVYSSFKTCFGIFQKGYNAQQGHEFEQCVGFRRLDELKAIVDVVSNRLTKDETLDLPPKLYQRRFFELTPEQERVYREIKQDAIALLDSGDTVTAPLAITRLLRLQQVTCGYVPTDDGQGAFAAFDKNPRLELLKSICDDLSHQAIIWARFTRDIDLIMEMLRDKAVRYDGSVSSDDRIQARTRFQNGEVQFFVGNPAAGGTGITLTAARTVIYASNSFKLTERLQSEDRAHRPGQLNKVLYIDLIAPGTVDEYIVAALRSKLDIASILTGDKLREWI